MMRQGRQKTRWGEQKNKERVKRKRNLKQTGREKNVKIQIEIAEKEGRKTETRHKN